MAQRSIDQLGPHRRYATGDVVLAPTPHPRRNRRRVRGNSWRWGANVAPGTRGAAPSSGVRAAGGLRLGTALVLLATPTLVGLLVDAHGQRAEAAIAGPPSATEQPAPGPADLTAAFGQRPGLLSPHTALAALLRRQLAPSGAASPGETARATAHRLCNAPRTRARVGCPHPGQAVRRAVLFAQDAEEPTGQEPTGQEPTGQEPTGQWLCTQFCVDIVDSTREGPYRAWQAHGGRIAARGSFRDGRAHGRWWFYHPGGGAKLQGQFSAGHAHGTWRAWSRAGTEQQPSLWRWGLKHRPAE